MMRALRLFNHLGLKVLSVGLAVLLWLVVAGEQTAERSLRVSLELEQFPSGLELQNEPPSTVDVRVRGQSSALARLTGADVVAMLDLSKASPGQQIFPLNPEAIQAPDDIQVVQVIPASLTLAFEKTATRLVKVDPPLQGHPAAGFEVGDVTCDPSEVEVIGPATAIARLQSAFTEPIDIDNASRDVQRIVKVGLSDPRLRLRSAQTTVVTVRIRSSGATH
jgi:YbbR domain-containing protein